MSQQGRLGFLWQAAHPPSPPPALGDWIPVLIGLTNWNGEELRVRVGIARHQPCPDVTPKQGSVTLTSGPLDVPRTGRGAASGRDGPESLGRVQLI